MSVNRFTRAFPENCGQGAPGLDSETWEYTNLNHPRPSHKPACPHPFRVLCEMGGKARFSVLRPKVTMKGDPNEAGLAIEAGAACCAAFCGRQCCAPNPLVGSEFGAGSHLDGGPEPAAGTDGLSDARSHPGSGLCRRGHHGKPDVFHRSFSLSAVA